MKLQQVIDVILYMNDEKQLSRKEIYDYDIDKDGKIGKEDLVFIFESYAALSNCSSSSGFIS